MQTDWIIVIVGTIAVMASIVFTLQELAKSKQQKRISYSILLDAPLPPEELEKTKTPPQEEPITDARLIVIQIQNTGNMVVHPKDYNGPITFEFGEKVIRSEIGSANPASKLKVKDDIAPPLRPDEQSVALETVRLKPKEQIFISVLVSGPVKPIKVKGRIVDGRISEERVLTP